jgi:hypothetical protein
MLMSCVTPRAVDRASAGEVHNAGIRYVFARLTRLPSRDEASSVFNPLIQQYCESIRRRCVSLDGITPSGGNVERLLSTQRSSETFKDGVRSLFRALDGAADFAALDRSTSAVEREFSGRLEGVERERFSNLVSIARSSARLWAPISQGGLGGGGIRDSSGTAMRDIDWEEVAKADAEGCLVTIEVGCIEGAILFSAINIIAQSLD